MEVLECPGKAICPCSMAEGAFLGDLKKLETTYTINNEEMILCYSYMLGSIILCQQSREENNRAHSSFSKKPGGNQ